MGNEFAGKPTAVVRLGPISRGALGGYVRFPGLLDGDGCLGNLEGSLLLQLRVSSIIVPIAVGPEWRFPRPADPIPRRPFAVLRCPRCISLRDEDARQIQVHLREIRLQADGRCVFPGGFIKAPLARVRYSSGWQ